MLSTRRNIRLGALGLATLVLASPAEAQTVVQPYIPATTTGAANSLLELDSNADGYAANFISGSVIVPTAGGTTTLTVASPRQIVFTGSSSQTLVLPDATTLPDPTAHQVRFVVNNNGSGSITIQNATPSTIYTVPAGGYVTVNLLTAPNAAGTWDEHPTAPLTVTWGSGATGLVFNTALTTTPSINAGVSSATSPAFVPQRGSATTGFSGDSTHLYGVIGGSTGFAETSVGFGLGTITPDQLLTVNGVTDISGGGAVPGSGVSGVGLGFSSGNYGWIQSYSAVSLVLNPIANKVGIGTRTPGYELDVQGGQVNASGGYVANGTAGVSCGAGTVNVTTEVVTNGIVTHC